MSRRLKVQEPSEPVPEVYKNITIDDVKEPEGIEETKIKPVPNKTLKAFGAKIKFDKNMRAGVIHSNEYVEFIEELHRTLDTMDRDSIKYKENVLLFIMQSCENFVLHKKAGERRKALVIDVAKHYLYDGNEDLISERVEELFTQIKNYKFIRRNWRKVVRFFLNLW